MGPVLGGVFAVASALVDDILINVPLASALVSAAAQDGKIPCSNRRRKVDWLGACC